MARFPKGPKGRSKRQTDDDPLYVYPGISEREAQAWAQFWECGIWPPDDDELDGLEPL